MLAHALEHVQRAGADGLVILEQRLVSDRRVRCEMKYVLRPMLTDQRFDERRIRHTPRSVARRPGNTDGLDAIGLEQGSEKVSVLAAAAKDERLHEPGNANRFAALRATRNTFVR